MDSIITIVGVAAGVLSIIGGGLTYYYLSNQTDENVKIWLGDKENEPMKYYIRKSAIIAPILGGIVTLFIAYVQMKGGINFLY